LLDNFVAYAGTRHFVDAVNVDNNDVGIVVYRSGPNNASAYYFLDLIAPGVAAKSVTDNGLATDNTLRADVRTYEDLPRLDAAIHYRSMLLGFSWEAPPEPADDGRQPQFQGSSARIYYNDFRGEKSFLERWDVRNYKEIPLEDGEVFTALCPHALGVTLFSNNKTYDMQVRPLQSGRTDVQINPMYWTVGCVGPRAQQYVEGWVYWISDRGPYRWRPGALDPQFIGRNIQPMFIDPESGICKLNEQASAESEVFYDQDADVVRFAFPTGPWGGFINRHLMYNPRAVEYGLKFYQSWSMSSATAQTFDRGIYEPFIDGVPADPLEFRARSCFIDKHNYVMRFEPDSTRTNVSPSEVLTGTVQAASTTTLLRILGGLITTSLVGGMAEVVFSDGTAEVREIIANSATTISVDHPFSQDPIGATWYACGIHAIWRSWVDTVGNPAAHKDLTHLHVGYNTEFPTSGFVVDVNVSAAYEWPTTSQRSRTADLSLNREKMLIARVGRFWTYEFANTRPDEKMLITWFKADHKELSERT
jgi:hypothetical protein